MHETTWNLVRLDVFGEPAFRECSPHMLWYRQGTLAGDKIIYNQVYVNYLPRLARFLRSNDIKLSGFKSTLLIVY